MKTIKVLLDLRPFQIEIKLSGPTDNRHLRQALLQIVQAVEHEQVNFRAFTVVPARTLYYRDLMDPVWRKKHSHTIVDTAQAGYELRQKRLKLGFSGKKFARALDVHHTYLSHVEHGRRPVSESLRKRADSVFRTQIREMERRRWEESGAFRTNLGEAPLGSVVHEGQTFFPDLREGFDSVEELREFFEHIED
ncbi:MAG: helix-turn-helix transcriptional regulator [Bdellovibrionales bacterium]|nr:helix-turn-helix transcriptional regulator [Bdellovibrionales bacterium]